MRADNVALVLALGLLAALVFVPQHTWVRAGPERMFRTGPYLLQMWEGDSDSVICAKLTGMGEAHFKGLGRSECLERIERNFQAFYLVLRVLIGAFIVYFCKELLVADRVRPLYIR
jgi:hypothetical protein